MEGSLQLPSLPSSPRLQHRDNREHAEHKVAVDPNKTAVGFRDTKVGTRPFRKGHYRNPSVHDFSFLKRTCSEGGVTSGGFSDRSMHSRVSLTAIEEDTEKEDFYRQR